MPVGTPAAARMAASWPAPETSSGAPGAASRRAASGAPLSASRLGAAGSARSRSRRTSAVERGRVVAARASTERVTRAGTTFVAPGSTSRRPTVATVPPRAARAHAEHELGRVDERVVAGVHRRRAGVVGAAREDDLAARRPGDRGHDPERLADALEHRALLDVQLEERRRQVARRRRAARLPGAAALLVAEGDDRERDVRCRAATSIAATTPSAPSKRPPSGTESRCEPDQTRGLAAAPEGVAARVDLDLEPGLAQPGRDEPVRRRPPRPSSRSGVAPSAYSRSSAVEERDPPRPFWTSRRHAARPETLRKRGRA